ncbi:hypothetical protein ISCGN_009793 [Ixodes scapularis]
MSTGRPNFGPLNTLADVATRGQPLPAPRSPRIAQATVPLGGQRLSPTSASGLYSEFPASAKGPLTTSPSREPIQAEPMTGTVPPPEGYAAGDVSGSLGGRSAPPVPQRDSVSVRAGLLHDRATSASPLREPTHLAAYRHASPASERHNRRVERTALRSHRSFTSSA